MSNGLINKINEYKDKIASFCLAEEHFIKISEIIEVDTKNNTITFISALDEKRMVIPAEKILYFRY